MRGLDPINGRFRVAACAVLAILASASARAQDPAEGAATTRPAEPVSLDGDRVLTWDDGRSRWTILVGHASAFQETEGVRAGLAVVRSGPDPEAPEVERIEVYAEGDAKLSGDRKAGASRRLILRTTGGVRLSPGATASREARAGPPADLAPLIQRAFPGTTPSPAPTPAVSVATAMAKEPAAPTGTTVATAEAPAAEAPRDGVNVRALGRGRRKQAERDPAVVRTQDAFGELPGPPLDVPAPAAEAPAEPMPGFEALDPPAAGTDAELPAFPAPTPPGAEPNAAPGGEGPPALPALDPFPEIAPAPGAPAEPDPLAAPGFAASPLQPGSQRAVNIYPRNGGPLGFKSLGTAPDGTSTFVVTGGVNVLINSLQRGTIDMSADSMVIWSRDPKRRGNLGPGQAAVQDEDQVLEFYMEGNVVVRQDERTVAGNGDQKIYQASQAFYDVRLKRFLGLDAELDMFAPGLISPLRVRAERVQQFTDLVRGPNGKLAPVGRQLIQADRTKTTGSRFPNPGYDFYSKSMDITKTPVPLTDPNTGAIVPPGPDGRQPMDQRSLIDARQNVYWVGWFPAFYWPRVVMDPDDPTPPLQNIRYQYGNYFGNQILTDWNGFKLFGLKKPKPTPSFTVDQWNFDIDYLNRRGPALGSEFAYFGQTLVPGYTGPYFAYLDIWGILEHSYDVLGGGPAIVTDGPPGAGIRPTLPFGPGRAKYDRSAVPPFHNLRGRINFRQMQSLLLPDAAPDEDFRAQLEFGYLSDRHFLEEYYKRLFDTGLDQETLLYVIRQRQNHAFSVLTEVNLQNFYSETQWFPKLDYYRLGDSLWDRVTYFTNSGIDYANTHSAIEVGNANVFAFLPTDPVNNIGRAPLQTGRAWTSHEFDLPVSLGFLKVTPYVQGQAVGWDNQLGGGPLGRVWGAAGGRASVIAWKRYNGQWTESELLNIHGLNHKVQFDVDARFAYSNQALNRIGVQDDLDDNTYEYVRRYFAMSQFANAVLPPQYDPRFLILRRAISPITGTTDVQSSMDTIQLGIHQRLQTKRGPEGRRRIIDYMVLDLTTTYYPYSARDNFGKPFGQNMYNYEWYIGDRTAITSYGWFEFFDITGGKVLYSEGNPHHANNPFQFAVITAGVTMSRPPRANLYMGYSIIDTGPINTSALITSYSYLLSPKWYSTFSTMYDFGSARLLSASFTVTRVGADFLTSVGVNADPQRQNITAGIQISPRISPSIRLGSSGGLPQFDTRFSPTQ